MESEQLAEHIMVIRDFFGPEECRQLITGSEQKGYEAATVETERGKRRIPGIRNNQRILLDNPILADELWRRGRRHIPGRIGNSIVIGINELFRYYKYEPGQKFIRHIDESFIRNEKEASYYTFMIYLNDQYGGGETIFDDVMVKAEEGMALIFLHSLPHEGAEVTKGVKYVLRTDIMYRLADES